MTSSSSYAVATSVLAAGTGLPLSNQHQSAPQLYSSPSPDFSYSSLLPAPMAMIPESSLDNPVVEPVGDVGVGGGGDMVDFALEDLPEMVVDDWAIGEGFDMDVDPAGGSGF